MNRFIYHYHAMREESPGRMAHIDGIADMGDQILSWESYKRLKQTIANDIGLDGIDRLTICSLSLLGCNEQPQEAQ